MIPAAKYVYPHERRRIGPSKEVVSPLLTDHACDFVEEDWGGRLIVAPCSICGMSALEALRDAQQAAAMFTEVQKELRREYKRRCKAERALIEATIVRTAEILSDGT